jgi:RNA 2',3'-cyclic 3'-phosphodiesterase
VRVFVALDIPEEVRRRIADFAAALQKHAPRARWVRLESIHVTLKFIGHAPPPQVEEIRRALGLVRAESPAELQFRGAGFFPDERRPRVLWVGIEANAGLAELAEAIERALEPLGIARESRAFHPHLTLARFEEPRSAGHLQRALAEAGTPEFGGSVERAFHLYESKLGAGGARYTKLETYIFAPEA